MNTEEAAPERRVLKRYSAVLDADRLTGRTLQTRFRLAPTRSFPFLPNVLVVTPLRYIAV